MYQALVLVIALISGCVSTQILNPPTGMSSPEPIVEGICPNITGRYSILSEEQADKDAYIKFHPHASVNISIYSIFFWSDEIEHPKVGYADIWQDGDKLIFAFTYRWTHPTDTLEYKEKILRNKIDYECSADGIKLIRNADATSGAIMPGVGGWMREKKEVIFKRARNGALLANIRKSTGGLFLVLVIPAFFNDKSDTWWKWEKLEGS